MEFITFQKIRIFLLVLFFSNCSINLFSQEDVSNVINDSDFLELIDNYLSKNKNDDLLKVRKDFNKLFENNSINQINKKLVKEIFSIMIEKDLNPLPYFRDVMSTVIIINSDFENKFNQWLRLSLKTISKSSDRKFLDFCNFSSSFFNTNNLSRIKSIEWLTDSDDFVFKEINGLPCIEFNSKANLICNNNSTSIKLYEVSGFFNINKHEFVGSSARVDWSEKGFSSDSVYALLDNFVINVKNPEIKSDSVLFYNKSLFSQPIYGSFYNKCVRGNISANFPEFNSYRTDLKIDNILPNIYYKGGYSLRGNKFIADGREDASACIIFKSEGKEILVASAISFNFSENIIYSESAGIKIYFDNDSIFHSGLEFRYNHIEKCLKLYRENNGGSSPLYSSYHQLTIDAEMLEWKIDEDNILIGSLPSTSESSVSFESVSSYNDKLFHSLRGIDKVNPLILVKRYVQSTGMNEFLLEDFASFAGYPKEQIHTYLFALSSRGFLYYNVSTKKVIVHQKLFNYVKARTQKGDYDVIRFKSSIKNSASDNIIVNSSLNLSTKNLEVTGVDFIRLSDSQHVYVEPLNGDLTIKKNRDFDFSGKISAGMGRFVLYGSDFNFQYDNFKINLNKIDSVQLSVPIEPFQIDQYGNKKLVRIQTVLQSVTGDLMIDKPDNKSGLRKGSFPEYPIFRSFEDSYAYYDSPYIYDGVYNREYFSFHLNQFEIDSLENFDGRGLRFPGIFQSSGIFPEFPDTLTMMDDYSLGFIRSTPTDGFDLYGGKAKYFNNIILSNGGLQGNGEFKYLNSLTKSEEIYFFPDSTAIFSQEFVLNEIEEGIEFPQVSNTEIFGLYEPYNDKYTMRKMESDFAFYKQKSIFDGDIVLKPTGLIGFGKMILDLSLVESNLFSFNANWFDADTANLKLFNDIGDKILFESNNLKTHIDIEENIGRFYSNGKGSYVELSANQYICYIDQLHWDMNNNYLNLGNEFDSSEGSKFVSINPNQDSLSFIAKTSNYNLNDNIVNVYGVKEMIIGDAIIYPESGFQILENAVIPTINDVTIIADLNNKFHKFFNASIDIDGRNKYTASGEYSFVDSFYNGQKIYFDEIKLNDRQITIASGQVKNNETFSLGPKYQFKGEVNLQSTSKNLNFDGYFKINSECDLINPQWVSFNSEINPSDVRFKLNSVIKNDNEDTLLVGLCMNEDSINNHLYSSLFSMNNQLEKSQIFRPQNYLYYDTLESAFILNGIDSSGNKFIFYEETCDSYGEGIIDLNIDFGQVSLETFGNFYRNEEDNTSEFHVFLLLDFMFNKDALKLMSENIFDAYGVTDFKFGEFYKNTLSSVVGLTNSRELLLDIEAFDEFKKFPKELNKTITFTDLKLIWDDKQQAYLSKGRIGVGNVYEKQLNSVMDGWVRIKKKGGRDVLSILLKTEYGDVYFFEYKNNVMYSYSNNFDFNDIISNLKDKKRISKDKKTKSQYMYVICDEERMFKFEREMLKYNQ
tara:strand:- start:594 stop:5042 length:4449 start_codon:yes stop_codon:yes gene_type:complete